MNAIIHHMAVVDVVSSVFPFFKVKIKSIDSVNPTKKRRTVNKLRQPSANGSYALI